MVNRSKNIGTAGESAVVRYLRDHGFPHAERRALAGRFDLGDILTPGICWEVKSGEAAMEASDGQVNAWLVETETERQNAHADVGVLVLKRRRKTAADWWAIVTLADVVLLANDGHHQRSRPEWGLVGVGIPMRLRLADAVTLLRLAGYGDALPDGAVA